MFLSIDNGKDLMTSCEYWHNIKDCQLILKSKPTEEDAIQIAKAAKDVDWELYDITDDFIELSWRSLRFTIWYKNIGFGHCDLTIEDMESYERFDIIAATDKARELNIDIDGLIQKGVAVEKELKNG